MRKEEEETDVTHIIHCTSRKLVAWGLEITMKNNNASILVKNVCMTLFCFLLFYYSPVSKHTFV